MDRPEADFLIDRLDLLAERGAFTVSYFLPPWIGTVPAAELVSVLRQADAAVGPVTPTFWVPHTRRWVASTPYDGGWTYTASDKDLADRLQADPDIEALPCTCHA